MIGRKKAIIKLIFYYYSTIICICVKHSITNSEESWQQLTLVQKMNSLPGQPIKTA